MPDLQNVTFTSLGNATINAFPRFSVDLKVADSQTHAALFDFTGVNNVVFPNDIVSLYPTVAERLELAKQILELMVRKKAGL